MKNKELNTYKQINKFLSVFRFIEDLQKNKFKTWKDKYGTTEFILAKGLLHGYVQNLSKSNATLVMSPILKEIDSAKTFYLNNYSMENSFTGNEYKIISIGGAKEHNCAKELVLLHDNIKKLITIPIPLTNDSFCTNRSSQSFGDITVPSRESLYPSKVLIDLKLLEHVDEEQNKKGIGEIVGMYYSINDFYLSRDIKPPLLLVNNVKNRIYNLINSLERDKEIWLNNLAVNLIMKCLIMRVSETNAIGAGGDHIIAYGLEYYNNTFTHRHIEMSHGELVYLGSIVMAAIFQDKLANLYNLKTLINIGLNNKLISYDALHLMLDILNQRNFLDFTLKIRPKRRTILRNISYKEIQAVFNRIKEAI